MGEGWLGGEPLPSTQQYFTLMAKTTVPPSLALPTYAV